jgi:PAT family beta-lactamase induction signal transducer AmpG
LAFSQTEVGLVNKMLGMFATIGGVVLGGVLMLRWGLWRSLLVFAILQAVSNLGFWSLAHYGQNALGHFTLPTGEFARVLTGNQSLSGDLSIDYLLAIVVGFENITGGMGTAAFVALLMGLSRGGHSLTYYALLSALASLGRIYVGPVAGVLAEPENLGWANFFIFATLMGFPAVLLLLKLRQKVHQLS